MRGASLLVAVCLLFLTFASAPPAGAAESTSFAWSTREALGDTAARAIFTLPVETDCSFGWAMGGSQQEKGGGVLFFYIERTDQGEREVYGSSVVSAYASHQVHVGDVDSRGPINVADEVTLFPTGTWGGDGSTSGTFPAGTYDFSLGGIDLHSTNDDPEGLGYHSLGIDVSCDDPFTVGGFMASHELMLFSPANMDGGVGAFESLVAQVSIGDSAEKTFTAGQVESHVSWREYQDGGHAYGTVERTTPEGTTTYDLTEPADVRIRDTTGPGLHRYVMDRVALDFFSTFTGVAYGLDSIGSLDEIA